MPGTLPATWGGTDAFPALQSLSLQSSQLSGSLPTEWGSATAFKKLYLLELYNISITGTLLPSTHVRDKPEHDCTVIGRAGVWLLQLLAVFAGQTCSPAYAPNGPVVCA